LLLVSGGSRSKKLSSFSANRKAGVETLIAGSNIFLNCLKRFRWKKAGLALKKLRPIAGHSIEENPDAPFPKPEKGGCRNHFYIQTNITGQYLSGTYCATVRGKGVL